MFFYSNESQVRKFQVEKLANVWRPHFKSLPLNCYMSQNKTFTKKPSNTWKTFLHKLEISLETCNNGKEFSLTHLKFEVLYNLKTYFQHTSNFNVETFNNLKNFLPHTFNLKLKNLKNIHPHLKTYNTLKKSLPHLPFTWKCCTLLVCHHLEMDSHSLCKLKAFPKKKFPFFYAIQVQNLSLCHVLTQCPFFCLVWAHNLLETTWKQARNETFKVHEIKQLLTHSQVPGWTHLRVQLCVVAEKWDLRGAPDFQH
jgi:hypothetical protein